MFGLWLLLSVTGIADRIVLFTTRLGTVGWAAVAVSSNNTKHSCSHGWMPSVHTTSITATAPALTSAALRAPAAAVIALWARQAPVEHRSCSNRHTNFTVCHCLTSPAVSLAPVLHRRPLFVFAVHAAACCHACCREWPYEHIVPGIPRNDKPWNGGKQKGHKRQQEVEERQAKIKAAMERMPQLIAAYRVSCARA